MILGIDIGGTATKFVLMEEIRVVLFKKYSTAKTAEEFLRQLYDFTQNTKVHSVGISIAGVIDQKTGILIRSVNLPQFEKKSIERLVRKQFLVPIKIDNDARCFLRAEATLGAVKKYRNVLGLVIGTGIGGALLIDKKIYSGGHFSAGEVGHAHFWGADEWEFVTGGRLFSRLNVSATALGEKARKGVSSAKKVFEKRGEQLGSGIADLMNIIDPEVVVIGGGALGDMDLFLPSLMRSVKKNTFNPKASLVPIVRAKLGEQAGAIGAALLFSKL